MPLMYWHCPGVCSDTLIGNLERTLCHLEHLRECTGMQNVSFILPSGVLSGVL